MRIEFRHGVPDAAVTWLKENVGAGNIRFDSTKSDNQDQSAWFYERIEVVNKDPRVESSYVPTITVKDPRLAMLFAIMWSGQ